MSDTDRIELAQQGLRPADETEAGWFVPMIGGRKVWATDAEDTCSDCAPVKETRTNSSILSLAFEQAERELGARIGYPALVYDVPSLIDSRDDALDAMAEQDAEIARLRAELTKVRAAALSAYHLIDSDLDAYDGDDGPPPAELLNAHALLYEALELYEKPNADNSDDLPF